MTNYKISVIIPVYGAEKYLRKCVDSILAQTFKNFEIILIDDGSPDKSGQICDEYSDKYENVVTIHQTNKGINKARQTGVVEANAEWITFVDDDDMLPADSLVNMYAQTEGTDLVIGSFTKLYVKKNLSLEECRKGVINSQVIPPHPWGKLYRKELFTNFIFDFPREVDGAEDMIMSIRILFAIERPPHFVNEKVYNFLRHRSSASHKIKKTLDYEDMFDECRIISIPEKLRTLYMKEIISNRINGLIGVALNDPYAVANKHHHFFDKIFHDVKLYDYKMNLKERILVNSTSPLLIKLMAYSTIVLPILKYRLGFLVKSE